MRTSGASPRQGVSRIHAAQDLGHFGVKMQRSEDGGENWEKRSDYLSSGTGPHYYQEIFARPHLRDRVYQMDATLHITNDGGQKWVQLKGGLPTIAVRDLAIQQRENDLVLGTFGRGFSTPSCTRCRMASAWPVSASSAANDSPGRTACTSSTFSNWCWRIMPRVSRP